MLHQLFGGSDIQQMLSLLKNQGVDNVRPEQYVISSDSGSAMWELAKSGMGITLLPEVLGDREPDLEKVVPHIPSIDFPVWLVTHSELRTTPRICIVFDALAKGLKALAGKAL